MSGAPLAAARYLACRCLRSCANLRVGARRADAVRDYLVKQHGIDESRIQTQSSGESHPVADNQTSEGRKQNRRVEIELFVE